MTVLGDSEGKVFSPPFVVAGVHVRVSTGAHTHVCIYVHAHVCGGQQSIDCPALPALFCFVFKIGTLNGSWVSLVKLRWLASKSQ